MSCLLDDLNLIKQLDLEYNRLSTSVFTPTLPNIRPLLIGEITAYFTEILKM